MPEEEMFRMKQSQRIDQVKPGASRCFHKHQHLERECLRKVQNTLNQDTGWGFSGGRAALRYHLHEGQINDFVACKSYDSKCNLQSLKIKPSLILLSHLKELPFVDGSAVADTCHQPQRPKCRPTRQKENQFQEVVLRLPHVSWHMDTLTHIYTYTQVRTHTCLYTHVQKNVTTFL